MAWKPNKKKILFVLVTLFAAFLVCEIFVRVVFVFFVGPRVMLYGTSTFRNAREIPSAIMKKVGYTPATPENPVGSYMKFTPHEIKFDQDENGERFSPTINSRGFRGEEYSDEKEPGVVRVVTLGASSTFGFHDRDDETYPHFLERRLNEDGGGRSFEVINLGIPHIDSSQIVALFLAEALPLDPDVVTLYAGLNDAGQGAFDIVEQRSGFGGLYEGLRSRLMLVAFFDSFLYYAGTRRFYEEDLHNLQARNVERFLANVAALHDECSKRGILFLPATQQARSKYLERDQVRGVTYAEEMAAMRERISTEGLARREFQFLMHDPLMRGLRDWAGSNGVPLVDVISELDGDRSVLLTYVHLSAEGNRRVADAFASAILERIPAERAHSVGPGSGVARRDPKDSITAAGANSTSTSTTRSSSPIATPSADGRPAARSM